MSKLRVGDEASMDLSDAKRQELIRALTKNKDVRVFADGAVTTNPKKV